MKHLKKIIKAISTHPEKAILWLFLTILLAMSLYLTVRWYEKEPLEKLIPTATQIQEAPVLVDFGGLLWEKGSYRKSFQRNPFSHLPLVPEEVELVENDVEPVENDVDEVEQEPVPIVKEPLPRVEEVMIIRDMPKVLIRIGRKTYWVRGGETINGWEVLNVEEKSIALYNEKRGEKLILVLRK